MASAGQVLSVFALKTVVVQGDPSCRPIEIEDDVSCPLPVVVFLPKVAALVAFVFGMVMGCRRWNTAKVPREAQTPQASVATQTDEAFVPSPAVSELHIVYVSDRGDRFHAQQAYFGLRHAYRVHEKTHCQYCRSRGIR